MKHEYEFIGKTLFFPEKGILVIGDLHIGYEHALMESGILLPEQQVQEAIVDMEAVFEKVKKQRQKIKKVVFLGDIKHFFSYEWKEKSNFVKVMYFLKTHVDAKNIVIIKGNHDTMNLGFDFQDYHIDSGIAFLHGHEVFPEVLGKEVRTVVSGHLHPSVILSENPGVKSESYKCFLTGHSQGKEFIVVPSFSEFYEGTPVNNYREEFVESFSIIPRKDILKFKIHIVGEDVVYDFGTVKDL